MELNINMFRKVYIVRCDNRFARCNIIYKHTWNIPEFVVSFALF